MSIVVYMLQLLVLEFELEIIILHSSMLELLIFMIQRKFGKIKWDKIS